MSNKERKNHGFRRRKDRKSDQPRPDPPRLEPQRPESPQPGEPVPCFIQLHGPGHFTMVCLCNKCRSLRGQL